MNGHLKYFLSHSASWSKKEDFFSYKGGWIFPFVKLLSIIATFINKKRPMVSYIHVLVTDWTFGLTELFGRTFTVRFGPNDRTFFCRTQNFFLYYIQCQWHSFIFFFCPVGLGQNSKPLLWSVTTPQESELLKWSQKNLRRGLLREEQGFMLNIIMNSHSKFPILNGF